MEELMNRHKNVKKLERKMLEAKNKYDEAKKEYEKAQLEHLKFLQDRHRKLEKG